MAETLLFASVRDTDEEVTVLALPGAHNLSEAIKETTAYFREIFADGRKPVEVMIEEVALP